MGLEDLVNLILKPFEGVAQVVYDVCFATDIKREVGNDGKVSYKVQYMENNPIRPLFDKVKEGYTTIKDFGQKHVSRRFDKTSTFIEKYVNEWGRCDDLCAGPLGELVFQFPELLPNVFTWIKISDSEELTILE